MEEKTTQRARIIIQEIREWIESVHGKFHIRDLYNWIPELSKSTNDKRYISKCLSRLIDENLIERNGRYGIYRKIQTDLERMDFAGANPKGVDIWLPFNLTDSVEIMPGGIIVIAGLEDSGKTTIALNIAWANRNKWEVHYFNSELGNSSLNRRVSQFSGTEPMQWQEAINFYNLSQDFHDFIQPGPNKLNIIDFMEASGDDYPYVAGWIKKIHDKIIENGAVAIICLQKPPGRDEAVGGRGTLDKPRLYLAIGRGTIKIVRAKDWVNDRNPRDLTLEFKIVRGHDLIPTTEWGKIDKWNL